jgi:arabinan endo-1,5-alpha-L-arabinosidase
LFALVAGPLLQLALLLDFLFTGCGNSVIVAASEGNISHVAAVETALATYDLKGDTSPLLDPSIMRQGSTYYVFGTDVLGTLSGKSLPIRCSQDQVTWTDCGSVFQEIPRWIRDKVPGVAGLWAPDISYFNGLYHVYYSGSTLFSQRSVIGVATNVALDPADPNYKWVDQGEILESLPGDDFNAIDPNIVVDGQGRVFLTYGSFWSGIKQVELDAQAGRPKPNSKPISLATRPGVNEDPVEGASMVHHGTFYYLFLSIDHCCNADFRTNNYKEIVCRSTMPQGPFVDMDGTPLMKGGGTILLQAQGIWNAPGGMSAYIDPQSGESLVVFHALKLTENGAQYLWLKHIAWQNDWPVLQ